MLLPPCMPTNSRRRRHQWPWRILGMCGLCVFIFGIIGARQRACDCGQCTQCLCGFAPPAEGWAHRTKWCKSVNTHTQSPHTFAAAALCNRGTADGDMRARVGRMGCGRGGLVDGCQCEWRSVLHFGSCANRQANLFFFW